MSSSEGTTHSGIPQVLISVHSFDLKKEDAAKDSVLIAVSGTKGPHYTSRGEGERTSTRREGLFSPHTRSSSRSCSYSPSSRLVKGPRATTICTASSV